jgi:hypothetical protein
MVSGVAPSKGTKTRRREKVRETQEVIGTPHEDYVVPKIGFGDRSIGHQ